MKNISQKRTTQRVQPVRMANIAQGRVTTSPPVALESSLHAGWESLPLRLFLGIIFFFAGLDKLTDPTFFDSHNGNYIGNQLQGYVTYNHSPLSFLLTGVAIPHAQLFGLLFALGELGVGLFALVGLFTRAASALGLLLSTTLWLTASWGQTPFYTGWDLPYMFGWLTLLLLGAGMFSLDDWRARQAAATSAAPVDHERRHFLVRAGATAGAVAAVLIAGGEVLSGFLNRGQDSSSALQPPSSGTANPAATPGSVALAQPTSTIAPAIATDTPLPAPTDTTAPAATEAPGSAVPTDTPVSAAPTDTPVPPAPVAPTDTPVPPAPAAPANGILIAKTSDVPAGSGMPFTDPGSGDTAYLVHLSSGNFVAFSAICTHEGCTVNYSQNAGIFFCPCHGAEFDPTNNGAVLRRPARSPLAKLNISVDNASGNIYFISS